MKWAERNVSSCFSWKLDFYRRISTTHLLSDTSFSVQIWASPRDNSMQGTGITVTTTSPNSIGLVGGFLRYRLLEKFYRESEFFGQGLLPQGFEETRFQWVPRVPGPNREVLLLDPRTSLPMPALLRGMYRLDKSHAWEGPGASMK